MPPLGFRSYVPHVLVEGKGPLNPRRHMESSCGAESKLTDGANSKVARRRVGERECLCEDLLSNPRIPREGFALTDAVNKPPDPSHQQQPNPSHRLMPDGSPCSRSRMNSRR
jgi:hypothetical protein